MRTAWATGRHEKNSRKGGNGRKISAPWSLQALSKQRPGPSAKATQRWRERAGGRSRERRAGGARTTPLTEETYASARGWPCGDCRGGWGSTPGTTWRAEDLRDTLGFRPRPLLAAPPPHRPPRSALPASRGYREEPAAPTHEGPGPRSEVALPQLTSLAPGFPPAALSSPSSPPPAAPHQSQRRFLVAPPPRGATAHRQGGRSSARRASQKAGAGLARCPPSFQMV